MKSKFKRKGVGSKFRVTYFIELPGLSTAYSRHFINEWMTGGWTDGKSVLYQW